MKLLVGLALLGSALAAFNIDMDRVESKREKLFRMGTWTEHVAIQRMKNIARKYAAPEVFGSTNDPLFNTGDSLYSGKITLGTPQQQFTMVMDTGSSNTWIPAEYLPTS